MLKKVLLLVAMLFNILTAVKAETYIQKTTLPGFFDCPLTQTNFSIELTYGPTSFSTSYVNFAARYVTNPYSQSQWQAGVVVGHISCTPATYVYGRRTQYDGRVMEVGITTSGDVVIKWVSGPLMPTSTGSSHYYFLEMPNVTISSSGV